MALQLEGGDKTPTSVLQELEAEILFNRGQTYSSIGGTENYQKAI